MKKYYYELQYFFSRSESGSIGVVTRDKLDTSDIDECILYLDSRYLLNPDYIENIISIEEISKDEYLDKYFIEEKSNKYNQDQKDRIYEVHELADNFIDLLTQCIWTKDSNKEKYIQSIINYSIKELRNDDHLVYYPDPLGDE